MGLPNNGFPAMNVIFFLRYIKADLLLLRGAKKNCNEFLGNITNFVPNRYFIIEVSRSAIYAWEHCGLISVDSVEVTHLYTLGAKQRVTITLGPAVVR